MMHFALQTPEEDQLQTPENEQLQSPKEATYHARDFLAALCCAGTKP